MATITTTSTASGRKPLYTSLFVQVLAALVLGIVLGVATPDFAVSLKILSDAFLKLISMIVAPIVFCVVVHGIAPGPIAQHQIEPIAGAKGYPLLHGRQGADQALGDRKSTRLNSSHRSLSRMPSSA